MLNFFKTNKNEAASRKSFDKMQQLLFDADSYMKAGHKDVAKALLHELVREAERNTDKIAEEIYPPIMPAVDFREFEPAELEFENEADQKSQSFRSFMNDQHSIQNGVCVAEQGGGYCIHCVDHCQALDNFITSGKPSKPLDDRQLDLSMGAS